MSPHVPTRRRRRKQRAKLQSSAVDSGTDSRYRQTESGRNFVVAQASEFTKEECIPVHRVQALESLIQIQANRLRRRHSSNRWVLVRRHFPWLAPPVVEQNVASYPEDPRLVTFALFVAFRTPHNSHVDVLGKVIRQLSVSRMSPQITPHGRTVLLKEPAGKFRLARRLRHIEI